METTFKLSKEELQNVKLSTRLITDRLYEKYTIEECLEEGVFCLFSRADMFWVEVKVDGQNLGAALIDPRLDDPDSFTVSKNHCKIDGSQWEELRTKIEEWFLQTPQFQQQREWMGKIIKRFFEPFDGWAGWLAKSREAQKRRMEHKTAVAKKYGNQIQQFIDGTIEQGDDAWKQLNAQLKEEGVYKNSIAVSGFEHMVWVYRNKVKGESFSY